MKGFIYQITMKVLLRKKKKEKKKKKKENEMKT